jgi:hypothetical protein
MLMLFVQAMASPAGAAAAVAEVAQQLVLH